MSPSRHARSRFRRCWLSTGHVEGFCGSIRRALRGQKRLFTAVMVTALGVLPSMAVAEGLGNLAQYPPITKQVTITTSEAGQPLISPGELRFESGRYYRLALVCPDVTGDLSGWRIEMPGLLNNAHLRLVSIGDIEVHLQGLSFRAIECDEVGTARISFVPIKPGNYELYVGNVPMAVGRPMGEAGPQRSGKYALGTLIVE